MHIKTSIPKRCSPSLPVRLRLALGPTLRMRKIYSYVVYFGWMLVVSYTFAIITGTIGFLASFFFVRYIYSSIKVD